MDADDDKPDYEPKPFELDPEPDPVPDPVPEQGDEYDIEKHDWSGFAEKGRPGSVDVEEPPPTSFESSPPESGESDDEYMGAVGDGSYDEQITQDYSDGVDIDEIVGRFGDRAYKVLGIAKPTPKPHIPADEQAKLDRLFGSNGVPEIVNAPDHVAPAKRGPEPVPAGYVVAREPQPLDGCLDLTHVVEPGVIKSVPADVTGSVREALDSVTADVDAELEPIKERRCETMREIVLRLVVRRAYAKASGVGVEKYMNAVRDAGLDDYLSVVKAALSVLDQLENLVGASDPTLRITLRKLQIRKEKEDRK